jgi:23S rRNA U2552 (ribose-2'-O)-methylase RlmE/FtsJ
LKGKMRAIRRGFGKWVNDRLDKNFKVQKEVERYRGRDAHKLIEFN